MSSERKFTDVSKAYNANVAVLNEARGVFQKELEELTDFVREHLSEASRREVEEGRIQKVWWGRPDDWSTTKDGAWLNHISGTIIPVHILQPGYKRKNRGAAHLYFECRFDKEFGCFIFRCRFENSNSVNKNIDEKLYELIDKEKPTECKNAVQIKANTVLLFRHELNDELFDNLHDYIDKALVLCEGAVDGIFPDNQYAKQVVEEVAASSEELDIDQGAA